MSRSKSANGSDGKPEQSGEPSLSSEPPSSGVVLSELDEPDTDVHSPHDQDFDPIDTVPGPRPPGSLRDSATRRASRAAAGFDESIDTEVDFDAIKAVEELEASLVAEPATSPGDESGAGYVGILESEVEQLSSLVAEKEGQLAERDAKLRDADDEMEKSRGRIEREAKKQLEQRSRKLLLGFLEVLDDLERALAAAREADHNPAVVDGVELVRKRFLAKLESFGVSHRPALGERFDPEFHDAVTTVPTSDPAQDGVVVGVIHEGYVIGDEPLRPAGVAVGKASG